jgi:hypothetical protein
MDVESDLPAASSSSFPSGDEDNDDA